MSTSMLPPVYATLRASAEVLAFVGTDISRIWRHGEAPQDTAQPYITWSAAGFPENTLSETPAIDRWAVQVDCWHPGDEDIETMAAAVRDAIEPHAHLISVPINQREPKTLLFRIALQFDWFHGR